MTPVGHRVVTHSIYRVTRDAILAKEERGESEKFLFLDCSPAYPLATVLIFLGRPCGRAKLPPDFAKAEEMLMLMMVALWLPCHAYERRGERGCTSTVRQFCLSTCPISVVIIIITCEWATAPHRGFLRVACFSRGAKLGNPQKMI